MGPRERAIDAGVEALGDAELVALVLGTGIPGKTVHVLAAGLLDRFGGVSGLIRAGMGELVAQHGVGRAKGARLAAALELGRRVANEAARGVVLKFPSSPAVDMWARPRLSTLDHEELWILVLDGNNGLRAARRVASGGLHGLHVMPRDALRLALREGGSAFILVHNHPSGDPSPSKEDIFFTREMAKAAEAIATPLIDHVVVSRTGYVSILQAHA